jgi:hypothetical protein
MKNAVFWDVTPCGSSKNQRFGGKYRTNHQDNKNQQSLLLSFWTLSIVRISTNRKHNVSETGSVSVFRRGGRGTYSTEKPKACLSTGDARTKESEERINKLRITLAVTTNRKMLSADSSS